jgi:hypothetical protein
VNRLIGERDWAAQEVSHLLFGIPLYTGSRQVITFDCRSEDAIGTLVDLDDEANSGKPILTKYKERRLLFQERILFDFLRNFEHSPRKVHKPRPRSKPRVIVYQPLYKCNPDHPDYENYCRTKIALHHPWRVYPSLPWQSCATWAAAFIHCKEHCQPLHPSDCLEPADLEPPLDDFVAEEPPDKDEHDPIAPLAGETTLRNPAAQYEDPDNLGDRTDDGTYDWSPHVDTYRRNSDPMPDVHAGIHWWSRARELHPSYAQIRLLSQ